MMQLRYLSFPFSMIIIKCFSFKRSNEKYAKEEKQCRTSSYNSVAVGDQQYKQKCSNVTKLDSFKAKNCYLGNGPT